MQSSEIKNIFLNFLHTCETYANKYISDPNKQYSQFINNPNHKQVNLKGKAELSLQLNCQKTIMATTTNIIQKTSKESISSVLNSLGVCLNQTLTNIKEMKKYIPKSEYEHYDFAMDLLSSGSCSCTSCSSLSSSTKNSSFCKSMYKKELDDLLDNIVELLIDLQQSKEKEKEFETQNKDFFLRLYDYLLYDKYWYKDDFKLHSKKSKEIVSLCKKLTFNYPFSKFFILTSFFSD